MFPANWLGSPTNASAKSVSSREIDRSRIAILNALAKYPRSILRDNLDRIYVVRELEFSGIYVAGTNSLDRVYISVEKEVHGYTNEFIESTFHHEFSSILLRNYQERFAEDKWSAANPAQFRYHESGTDAIKAGKDSENYDAKLSKKGFFSEYAMWALEDDFNTIATALFCGNENLWSEVERHSPIESKVAIAINFFQSLDEKLDRDFFRGLATHSQWP